MSITSTQNYIMARMLEGWRLTSLAFADNIHFACKLEDPDRTKYKNVHTLSLTVMRRNGWVKIESGREDSRQVVFYWKLTKLGEKAFYDYGKSRRKR